MLKLLQVLLRLVRLPRPRLPEANRQRSQLLAAVESRPRPSRAGAIAPRAMLQELPDPRVETVGYREDRQKAKRCAAEGDRNQAEQLWKRYIMVTRVVLHLVSVLFFPLLLHP